MSPTKQHLLYSRYPALFREKDLPMTQTCMCWGIEVQGDGWFQLLDTMCARLEVVRDVTGLDVAFGQVKEKMGGLRVYRGPITFPPGVSETNVTAWAGIIDAIISEAGREADNTCEETGDYGSLYVSPGGWYRTLSAAKAQELGYLSIAGWHARRAAAEEGEVVS